MNEASERLYDFEYAWWDLNSGVKQPTMLFGEVYKRHPARKNDAQGGADLLEITPRWRRPPAYQIWTHALLYGSTPTES